MSSKRRRMVGVVVDTKMAKTATVKVDRSYRHPLYAKVVRSSKTYLVHDELGCHPGDVVQIVESRPISKRKHFAIESVVTPATETEIAAHGAVEADSVEAQA